MQKLRGGSVQGVLKEKKARRAGQSKLSRVVGGEKPEMAGPVVQDLWLLF